MRREEFSNAEMDEEAQRITSMMSEKNQEMPHPIGNPTMFNYDGSDNLIKYQLDIKEELVRIERLLRKQVPKYDSNNRVYYEEPSEENQLFNDYGVNEIMNILAWYLSKNLILSNYSAKEINLRCAQFMDYLTDFIFNNYQKFGLDTKEKIKHYPMVVLNIVNAVESTYRRALDGEEKQSLRTARQVTQTEGMNQGMPQMQMGMQKRRSILKPWTW